MQKLETTAYVVMEQNSEPMTPENMKIVKENGLFFVRFDTTLQSLDIFNRNNRMYQFKPMVESLEAEHLIELKREKALLSEMGHPDSEEMRRLLTIDPKLTCARINDYRVEGKLIKGNVETLDDGMYGTKLTKMILQHMNPAWSLRAVVPLVKLADGRQIMRKKGHIVTWDSVILPSHKEAYADKNQTIQKVITDISKEGNVVQERFVPVHESALIDYIKEESKNIKIISNICEVALESAKLSQDKKFIIVKENGMTYNIKIEDKIRHDVSKYIIGL